MAANKSSDKRMLELSHVSVEQAVDGILWIDSTARIHRVNQAACRMLGFSQEELLTLIIPDFDVDYHDGDFWVHWEKAKNSIDSFESRYKKKNGQIFPVELTVSFVKFEGQSYACTFFRDISERKRKEEELRKALGELERLKRRLETENIYLQEEIKVESNFADIIGHSEALKKALQYVEQVAPLDTTVLILGETGTGKELLARGIHDLSSRKNRPLVKVNCAALPANLIESELFGHERGAFTGAISRKIGRFEVADRGTIFLDEIGDLPLELQAKLLRVLQEGEFERLGSSKTVRVDVRVIAATNRDLHKCTADGDFREDLYYRLNVFPIQAPPLRDRKEDIPELVTFFLHKHGVKMGKKIEKIPQKVMDSFLSYDWPGNIRELENIIERSLVLSQGNTLETGDPFRKIAASSDQEQSASLADVERQHICNVLEATGWVVSGEKGAAKILGLKPTTLDARMKKLGIKRSK